MKNFRSLFPFLALAILFLSLPQLLAAQDQDDQANQPDPPSRVARISFMQGSVSFQVSGNQDWVQADANRPLTTGDNLWADNDSRAELHIGSSAVRLSSMTGISILNLDDRTVQLQLAQGTIEVHVRRLAAGEAFEVDTPNIAFTLQQAGEYRIDTDPDGNSTAITVREGSGEVTGGGESYDLGPGQQYTFNGTDQLSYDAQPAPGFDAFEDWCQQRDQRENNSRSAQYVSRDIDGYYDLDDYGSWQTDPDYGAIWVPSGVAVGWAPYRYGHWVWVAPWGWTWVEDEPWGFAPFHYGRWAYVRGYWGWVPGPVVVRPVYSPAMVAFVGGGGASLAVSFGGGFTGVGWFPLGPRDVWVPAYRCSPRYFQTVNVTNTRVVNVTQVTNVYNITRVTNYDVTRVNYTYAHNNEAVTAVSRDTFVNARPVGKSVVRLQAEQIQSAHVVEQAPVQPSRTSYVSSEAHVSRAAPKVPFASRPVTAKLPPPTPVNRPKVFTNESKEFNQGSVRNNPPAEQPRVENQPPARVQSEPQPRVQPEPQPRVNPEVQTRQVENQPKPEERNNPPQARQNQPDVRYTPPVKAKDSMYDVHPPLNQNAPRNEPRSEPAPRSNPPAHSGGNPPASHSNEHPH